MDSVAIKVVLFLFMNGLLFGGAALVARFGLTLRDRIGVGLATVLLGWVYVVVGLEALGLFGQIRLAPALCLAVCALAFGVVCWWVRRRSPEAGTKSQDSLSALIPSAGCDREPAAIGSPSSDHRRGYVRAGLFLTPVLVCWGMVDVLIGGLCSPVQPVSDAPIYHLYFAVRWWQSGSLELVPTPFGESAAPYFPANGDVWFTWLLLSWSAETLAKVGQWPFLLVGMVAVYGLARQLGVARPMAAFPAALWGTGTVPLLHSALADVDLVMAALYLVGTYFLVRYSREGRVSDLICSAIAAGAVLGTKYIALLFVPWLVLVAVILCWRGRNRWSHLAVLLACLVVPSAFWYVRNALLTGNPLYPLHAEFFGIAIFGGWYRRETLLSSQYHIPATEWRALLQLLLRGTDPVLVPVWLAGLVTAVWEGFTREGRRLPLWLVGLACVHIAVFWLVNPYQTQDRFLFSAFALLAVPCALALSRWPVLFGPFAILIGWHLMIGPTGLVEFLKRLGISLSDASLPPLLPAPIPVSAHSWRGGVMMLGRIVLLCGLIMGLAWICYAWVTWRRRIFFGGLAGVIITASVALRVGDSWIPSAPLRFFPVAPQIGYTAGWLRLIEVPPRPARVAYAGTNLPFYLFGMDLRNQVSYVNINGFSHFRMHDYHKLYRDRGEPLAKNSTPDWDRREADEDAWLRNLRDQRVDLLFVGFVNRAGGEHNFYDREGFPIERTWADRHPEVFYLLHADPRTRLYAVQFQQ